ncbi:hypothetical protein PtA15_4A83 [Puccinia triticina]|uniref:DUF7872 domain-containing protein n=1 Tax=Puccinia triticina TaxID=208348 RepID=A0ABY7CEX2_9BASI|nr:uncharacterized protein PtA15_4A83 [Puccinia triticina]WAQ83635.1 hypothetical protein PtA15_4A83 [Puccinia triticina]WAR54471.1 hypothetical protein PtB15_4B88 [Puccinia triticina]
MIQTPSRFDASDLGVHTLVLPCLVHLDDAINPLFSSCVSDSAGFTESDWLVSFWERFENLVNTAPQSSARLASPVLRSMRMSPTKQSCLMTLSILCLSFIFNLRLSWASGLSEDRGYGLDKPNALGSLNYTLADAQSSCIKKPLSQRLWQDLKLDAYLEDYIGGKTLSVVAFANQVNMTNFACGIGRFCDAGELCSSAKAPAWYILVGIQNWNDMMNSIYKSIAFAVGTVQELAPSMVSDLSPPMSPFPVKVATIINIIAASVSVVPGFLLPGTGVWYYLVLQGALYTTFSEIGFYCSAVRPPPDVVSGYTKWTHYAWLLSLLQDRGQEMVANSTLITLQSGISTEQGIYGALKNGTFLQPGSQPSSIALERSLEEIIKVQLLAAILRSQNVYITRGSDPCNKSGPNGAFSGPDILSYCGKDGVMMNIVQANGKKTNMKFYGSAKIVEKHKFSVEFLTESAWKCQSKYNQYGYNPYQNGTVPTDVNSDCLFNLPVCDCTETHIAKARKKGMHTTKACHLAGVPVYAKDQQMTERIGLSR